MVLLQWNMGVHDESADAAVNTRRADLLGEMVDLHDPDWIALQEAPRQAASRRLEARGYDVDASRHRLLTAWRRRRWRATTEQPFVYNRASAVVLRETVADGDGRTVLLCNLHLPSLWTGTPIDISEQLRVLIAEIQSYRSERDTASEVIVGDFNLEPHEVVMYGSGGLYGSRSLEYATERETKRVRNGLSRDRQRALYNPSWRLYGASADPYGTLYYRSGEGGPWYVFDQALFSADLVEQTVGVQLVTDVGAQSLIRPRSPGPDPSIGSDHLPVVWTLALRSVPLS